MPISIVTPAQASIVHMFHQCENVEIILIANGWHGTEIELTHFSATQQDDEKNTLKKNFGISHTKLVPFRFLDPHKAREEATSMVIERQRNILCHQYEETCKEINIMENKLKEMKKDLKQLKMMKEKIGQNLQLLGSEVDHMVNKEKECKPSQESQTDITSEHIYYQTEDKQDENTLIDVQQSQHQVTEEIEQIHTDLKTVTQTTIEHNPTTGQMIQPPIDTTTSEQIVLPNQQQVIAQIHQQLEQSNFIPQCIQMVGYAEVPQQYITPKIQRRQASATLSQTTPR